MHLEEAIESGLLDFSNIPPSYYLLGLLSAFENRFQAMADSVIKEISWKQFFAIICIDLCQAPPTLRELSEILGSSHQNVKQILIKLERKGFVAFLPDEADRRKQRIVLTRRCREFCDRNDDMSRKIMERLFDGVSEREIASAIQTLMKIESNMREA